MILQALWWMNGAHPLCLHLPHLPHYVFSLCAVSARDLKGSSSSASAFASASASSSGGRSKAVAAAKAIASSRGGKAEATAIAEAISVANGDGGAAEASRVLRNERAGGGVPRLTRQVRGRRCNFSG